MIVFHSTLSRSAFSPKVDEHLPSYSHTVLQRYNHGLVAFSVPGGNRIPSCRQPRKQPTWTICMAVQFGNVHTTGRRAKRASKIHCRRLGCPEIGNYEAIQRQYSGACERFHEKTTWTRCDVNNGILLPRPTANTIIG
jgi:hypothetical protein